MFGPFFEWPLKTGFTVYLSLTLIPASYIFYPLLITFINSLYPDQDRQNPQHIFDSLIGNTTY